MDIKQDVPGRSADYLAERCSYVSALLVTFKALLALLDRSQVAFPAFLRSTGLGIQS